MITFRSLEKVTLTQFTMDQMLNNSSKYIFKIMSSGSREVGNIFCLRFPCNTEFTSNIVDPYFLILIHGYTATHFIHNSYPIDYLNHKRSRLTGIDYGN